MAPKGIVSENAQREQEEEDEAQEQQHFDDIDLEAVDFQPFLTTPSGIALNYHTSDHPEHKLLMKESFVDGEQDESVEQSSSYETVGSQVLHHRHLSIERSQPQSPRTLQKEEGLPRRHITLMGVVVFIGFIALWYIVDVTSFLNKKGAFVIKGTASGKKTARRNDDIPRELDYAYRDVNDLSGVISDTPVYWHVPRSTSTDMTSVMRACYGLEVLQTNQEGKDDISSSLTQSEKPTALITEDLWETASLFNATKKGGRLFSMFRNPMYRLRSNYDDLLNRQHEGQQKEPWTLEQYAENITHNYMVRGLVDVKEGLLSREHLKTAKNIVRTKILVGLEEDPVASLERFQTFFGWKQNSPEECTNTLPSQPNTTITDGQEFEFLVKNDILGKTNQLDMELFSFIKTIYEEQREIFTQ